MPKASLIGWPTESLRLFVNQLSGLEGTARSPSAAVESIVQDCLAQDPSGSYLAELHRAATSELQRRLSAAARPSLKLDTLEIEDLPSGSASTR